MIVGGRNVVRIQLGYHSVYPVLFLFREGRSMRRRVAAVLPLSSEQVEKLFGGIENTLIGTVYGGLAVAAGSRDADRPGAVGLRDPLAGSVGSRSRRSSRCCRWGGTAACGCRPRSYLLASGSWIKAIILVGGDL